MITIPQTAPSILFDQKNPHDLQDLAEDVYALALPWLHDVVPSSHGSVNLPGKQVVISIVTLRRNVPPVPSVYGYEITGTQQALTNFTNALSNFDQQHPKLQAFRSVSQRKVVTDNHPS